MHKSRLYYAPMKRTGHIPVILGPTCIGKTALAVDLSRWVDAEVISCDSRQIYIGMDIGTAKAPFHLQQIIRHHLIDSVYPDEKFNAQMWAEQAENAIREIRGKGKIPLIVCGTGLYLAALTEGFFPLPEISKEKRASIERNIQDIEERTALHDYLRQIDRESAERIHPHDAYRIRRAVEIYLMTGKPSSYHRRQAHKKKKGRYTFIGLTMDREMLYMRIGQRVEDMVRNGFDREVHSLLKQGYNKELGAFHAPGYREFIKYLDGILPKQEAIEETKTKTRNYAKRQFTWFKKMQDAKWFDVTEGISIKRDEIASFIQRRLRC